MHRFIVLILVSLLAACGASKPNVLTMSATDRTYYVCNRTNDIKINLLDIKRLKNQINEKKTLIAQGYIAEDPCPDLRKNHQKAFSEKKKSSESDSAYLRGVSISGTVSGGSANQQNYVAWFEAEERKSLLYLQQNCRVIKKPIVLKEEKDALKILENKLEKLQTTNSDSLSLCMNNVAEMSPIEAQEFLNNQ